MSIIIGCLSDTHGLYDERLTEFLETCDEIWHAGDIGSLQVVKRLTSLKPLKAVHGNIDGNEIRQLFPEHQRFMCEDVDVWLTHIGGYPGRYDFRVKGEINESPPRLFICGHSHILRIMNDEKLGLLHINPGAAGRSGFHAVQTAVRFTVSGSGISDLDVLELKKSPNPGSVGMS